MVGWKLRPLAPRHERPRQDRIDGRNVQARLFRQSGAGAEDSPEEDVFRSHRAFARASSQQQGIDAGVGHEGRRDVAVAAAEEAEAQDGHQEAVGDRHGPKVSRLARFLSEVEHGQQEKQAEERHQPLGEEPNQTVLDEDIGEREVRGEELRILGGATRQAVGGPVDRPAVPGNHRVPLLENVADVGQRVRREGGDHQRARGEGKPSAQRLATRRSRRTPRQIASRVAVSPKLCVDHFRADQKAKAASTAKTA